jgi:apolipoprotein N-acyltransferase
VTVRLLNADLPLPNLARLWPAAASLLAGALAAWAFPPWGVWPGLFAYALLLGLVDRADPERPLRSAFFRGWLAGTAFFLIGCWWVAQAFLVDAEHQGWMAPFAVAFLAMGIGLFWGLACALYRWIAPVHVGRVLVFAGVFGGVEWLRGHVLTGFPWNLPGETFRAGSALSQGAALVGAYGLTTLALFGFAAFAPLLAPGPRKARVGMAAAGVAVIAGLWTFGVARLSGASTRTTDTLVRIVQPDVPQVSKWSPAAFQSIVLRYVNLTARQGARQPDIIVWPEGALPISAEETLATDEWVEPAIAAALQPGQTLLIGTYRAQARKGAPPAYFNSVMAVQRSGAGLRLAMPTYDKYRLVPFGEFLPLEPVLTSLGVKDMAHVGDGFSPGPRPTPRRLAGAPAFQPLICYEDLYPGLAQDGDGPGGARPGWIVNVSNDAWFGPTSGPLQHFNLASYRAIEQGVPIIRATPTGVSAVIDAYGRPGQQIGEGDSGVIDTPLPVAAPTTLYARIGDLGFALLTLLGLSVALPWRRLRARFAPGHDG